jgi:hypothetical protein
MPCPTVSGATRPSPSEQTPVLVALAVYGLALLTMAVLPFERMTHW